MPVNIELASKIWDRYAWCRDSQVTDAKTLIGALWLQNVQRGDWALDWQRVGAA